MKQITRYIFLIQVLFAALVICKTGFAEGTKQLVPIAKRPDAAGKLYLSHTVLNGKYTLRMVTAQTNVTQAHVDSAWDLIRKTADTL